MVDVLEEELAQLLGGLPDLRGHGDVVPLAAGLDDGGDHGIDPLGVAAAQDFAEAEGDILQGDDPGADGVVDIVVDIGDAVGEFDDASLEG